MSLSPSSCCPLLLQCVLLCVLVPLTCFALMQASAPSDYSSLSATCNSTYPGKCLILQQEREFTLHQAKAYCGKFNFTLLKIESRKENNMIGKLVSPNAGAWIIADSLSDGSNSSLRFHPRCKSQCCGIYISSDGFWREDPCDRTHGIICQRKGVEEFPLLADLLQQMAYEQKTIERTSGHKSSGQKSSGERAKDLSAEASRETSSSSQERQGKSLADWSEEEPESADTKSPDTSVLEEGDNEPAVTDESIVRVHTVIGSVSSVSDAPAGGTGNNGPLDLHEESKGREMPQEADEKEEGTESSDHDKDADYDYDSRGSSGQDFAATTPSTVASSSTHHGPQDYPLDDSASLLANNEDLSANHKVTKSSLSTSLKLMMFLLGTLAMVTLVILMMHLVVAKSRSASYEVPPEAGLISREYTKW